MLVRVAPAPRTPPQRPSTVPYIRRATVRAAPPCVSAARGAPAPVPAARASRCGAPVLSIARAASRSARCTVPWRLSTPQCRHASLLQLLPDHDVCTREHGPAVFILQRDVPELARPAQVAINQDEIAAILRPDDADGVRTVRYRGQLRHRVFELGVRNAIQREEEEFDCT